MPDGRADAWRTFTVLDDFNRAALETEVETRLLQFG